MAPRAKGLSPWLCVQPGKRWTELFFLAYSPFWIAWALCILVPFRLYELCNEAGYLAIGVCAALPCVVLPLWLQPQTEAKKPWVERYWVKANLWIAIFSFIGNYFWTHYFYSLLGARYTFPSWRLNDVPFTLYLMTHAYFCLYFTLGNLAIRRVRHWAEGKGIWTERSAVAATVVSLSYATAIMETVTIAHFPYYSFQDRGRMYTIGSLFYAIYFFVGFPLFFEMDEGPRLRWSLGRAAIDALAAGMAVTILLDFWRLFLGPITCTVSDAASGLPWS